MNPVSVEALEHRVGNLFIIFDGRICHHNVRNCVGLRFCETPDMELVDRSHTWNLLEVVFDIFDRDANRDGSEKDFACAVYL